MINKKDKKAQMGIDLKTIMAFILGFIIVAMFLFILIFTSSTMAGVVGLKETNTSSFENQTTSKVMNETITLSAPSTIVGIDSTLDECTITAVTLVHTNNASAPVTVPSSNYTITGCKIYANTGLGVTLNNTKWNVTGTFTYKYPSTASAMNKNISLSGMTFASYFPTIFTILAIVIIFGLFALIIYMLYRVKGGGGNI